MKDNIFTLNGIAYSTLFGYNVESLLKTLTETVYAIIFRVKILEDPVGFVVCQLDDKDLFRRRW